MDKETRNNYIRRSYELIDNCTMGELAEVWMLSESTIGRIIREDPTIETRGKPDAFKEE